MTVIVTNIKINHGINLCSLLKALVVDTVAEESRTRRLSILDAFSYIGYAVGSKLGVRIKQVLPLVQKKRFSDEIQDFGWVALFSSNILLFVLLVLYVALGVRENHHTRKEKKENSKLNIQALLL